MVGINKPVLVFTDRPELAIVYACALGGVMRGKLSVRFNNMWEHWDFLESQLQQNGYLDTFFGATEYVFISVPIETYALNRMADYDPAYVKVQDRPVPFIPDTFGYRFCLGEDKFSTVYEDLLGRAEKVINAASDSITGELSFLHFRARFSFNLMIVRVAPPVLSNEQILRAFNAQGQDKQDFQNLANSCLLFERLNWLVNCNVSNAVMQASDGRLAFAAGRLEAVLLSYIDQHRKEHDSELRIVLRDKAGTCPPLPCRCRIPDGSSVNPAKLVKQRVSLARGAGQSSKHFLLNCFDLAVQAGWAYGIPIADSADAMWNLFVKGLITWPSPNADLPWAVKPRITASATQLSTQERFARRMRPGDFDNYFGWDKDVKNDFCSGIIVSEKSPDGVADTERKVYNLVGDSVLREVRFGGRVSDAAVFQVNGLELVPEIAVSFESASAFDWFVESAVSLAGRPYFDYMLLQDLLPLFEAALKDDFRHFSTPLLNLAEWGQIANSPKDGLSVTEKGKTLLNYLRNTPLVEPNATILWDRRLQKVSQGVVPAENVRNDFQRYVNDLVQSVKSIGEVMEMTGGIMLDDCRCPVCGSMMGWSDEKSGWVCGSGSCRFFIPGVAFGHELSVRDMALLLTKRETGLYFDFKDKSGNPYPGRLALDNQNRVVRSFMSRCKCPKCGGPMQEYLWGVGCVNKSGCGYTLSLNRNGVRLTEEDEIALFSGKRTRLIHDMVSAKGSRFSASLYLDKDFKIRFLFPDAR